MRKVLIMIALALFVGGISAKAIAAVNYSPVATELQEEEKKAENKKSKKQDSSSTKSGDCAKSCEGEKKSDCSGSSEGESKK